MKVIFYDRKNKQEVANTELHLSRLGTTSLYADEDEVIRSGRKINPYTGERLTEEQYNHAVAEGWFDQFPTMICFTDWEDEKVAQYINVSNKTTDEIVYKSKTCPSYQNWDLITTLNDLVVLRLED